MNLLERIEAHALANAVKFSGKANTNNVLPKIIGEFPEEKKSIASLKATIDAIVSKVNAMNADEQREKLDALGPDIFEKKEHRSGLKELDDVGPNGVVMRFAPSPSGPMHIGHAITGGLTSLYVKKYGGKFILRIEDTNSDNIYPPAYEMLPADGEWIFGNVTDVWIQSDRMPIYYSYVERFLDLGAVYVCTCSQEEFKKSVDAMQDCPCRNLPIDEQKARWKKMFDKDACKEGDCVLRFKAGMQHPNPAMRDFPLVRINDSEHPRQGTKYRVWPLMNLCVFVDDVEGEMTHVIRAKDHMDNAKRQELMYAALGKTPPKAYFLGRYNFEGLEISASKTRAKIDEGVFNGWDDIRVPFLAALRRRGYRPESLLKYTEMTGLSQVDKTVAAEDFFKTINSFNKDLIDPQAKRFFFVHEPIEVVIDGAPKQLLSIRMHPERDLGSRTFEAHDTFMLAKSDVSGFVEGVPYRMMDCLNFVKSGDGSQADCCYAYHSADLSSFKAAGGKRIIHFLPKGETVTASVLMPDGKLLEGLAEKNVAGLNIGDVIQFERFGFCRLDAVNNGKFEFWFTHK